MGIVCVSRHLKEELAWAIDKQLWVIMLFKTVSYTTKEVKNEALLSLKLILYVFLCGP